MGSEHNVAKFTGHYGTLAAFCEFGTSIEDTLQKTLDLYNSKHIKKSKFCFLALLVFTKRF
jgi:hypothetical protein